MSDDVHQTATWSDVAPLLQRWQMALFPHGKNRWHVCSNWLCATDQTQHARHAVLFAALPQAIAEVAARCEAAAGEGGG